MKILRILTHSLIWAAVNIGSVVLAFLVGHVIEGKRSQHAHIQLWVGPLIGTLMILIWSVGVRRFFHRLDLSNATEVLWTYGAALVCGPVLFTGIHYLTQGYLTSSVNLIVVFIYQAWANFFAVLILCLWFRRRPPVNDLP